MDPFPIDPQRWLFFVLGLLLWAFPFQPPVTPIPPVEKSIAIAGVKESSPAALQSSVGAVLVTPSPTATPAAIVAARPTSSSQDQVIAMIRETFGGRAETALCIAKHESGFGPLKTSPPNKDKWGSVDRGVFQINSHWHPEVTDDMAYDAAANIREAYRISNGGTNWNAWSTKKFCV